MPTTSAQKESATSFLLRAVHEHPNQITVIALGPVTNLALAARLDDNFASLAKELLFMGGGFSPNTEQAGEFTSQILDSPRMSFNIRWDPEAAYIVLHAPWPHITLVTEDSSQNMLFGHELMQSIAASAAPAAQYIAKFGSDKFPMWDDIAAAVFLDPSLAIRKREAAVDVDLDRGANYGATLSWTAEKQPHLGEPTVTAVLGVDAARTRDLFLKEITR
jgi:inosine-uridine nucleoside N-ribohydrolase